MKRRNWFAMGAALLAITNLGWTQELTNNVTFQVPVRLTNLSQKIRAIEVWCTITSLALEGGTTSVYSPPAYFPSGQIDRTIQVAVLIPGAINISRSNVANYSCDLRGVIQDALLTRQQFAENHELPEYRVSPTPATITGSFEWRPVAATPLSGTVISP
jgi:hypothetical protein